MKRAPTVLAFTLIGCLSAAVQADLLVASDGSIRDGTLVSQDAKEFVWQNADDSAAVPIERGTVDRVVVTDKNGAATAVYLAAPSAATAPAVRVFWALLAVSKEAGKDATMARRLLPLTIGSAPSSSPAIPTPSTGRTAIPPKG